ncbi:DUF4229 domain-containing protein, partial [Gordonia sp. NPDC057248]|uniref:DUF4229 domain-containing protein n=1 Tax=Gordonia sp. NPDC057248 TaxID=3346066 RepID=UPI00363BEB0E
TPNGGATDLEHPAQGGDFYLATSGDIKLAVDTRLALAAALTGLVLLVAYLIDVDVPFFVAVVLAVILSSPVSMIVLKPLRTRINHRAEAMDSRRATKKGLARPDAP